MDPLLKPLSANPRLITLRIATGHDVVEVQVDLERPIVPMANNAVTWILCPCGEHLISSQRQLEKTRTCYHVHCPRCGRAGTISGEVWRKMLAMLAPQVLAS